MVRYYDKFSQVMVNSGNDAADAALLNDSRGNDRYTGELGRAELSGTGFRNIAVGFTRVYAYQTGGADVATLTGSSGNDRIVGNANWTYLSTNGSFQQVFAFSVVNVSGGSNGVDTVDLTDSTGDDTLTAQRNSLEIRFSSGKRISVTAIDKVTARGTSGGTNRKTVASSLAYNLTFTGRWV